MGYWADWCGYQQGAEAGLTLRNGNPIDVVVSCHNKILSVSLTQDGVTRTYRQDASGAFADDRGALFGFFSHEHSGDAPVLNVSISDFEGWVSSSSDSPWQADPDFALTADNYYTYVDYKANSAAEITSLRGADAFDASGRLPLCEGCGWFGAAVSKKLVPDGSKFRMKWVIDSGKRSNNGTYTDIGFPKADRSVDDYVRKYYGNYDCADGSGYDLEANRRYLSAADPIKFAFDWWTSKVGMTRAWNHAWTGTSETSAVFCGANSSDSFTLFYDGNGNYETEVVNNKEGVVHLFELKGQALGEDRRLSVVGGANTDFGWQSYTQNWIRDLSLCFWNDAYVPPVSTRVVAPTAGTTEVGGLGAGVPFERITLGDVAARAKVTGTVAFGDELTIKVPNDFLKSIREETRLVDLSAATVSGSLPTAVTLVDSTGAAIPMRGRTLTVAEDGVTLSGPLGFFLLVK